MALTYWDYLKLSDLLELQEVKSDPAEHDEMLFIVIHQVYELWFKLMLHELTKINANMSAGDLYGAIQTCMRMRTMMKTLVGQLDILETMTPMSFTSFRDRLDTASGFQSAQFREFEFALGYKRPEMLKYQSDNAPKRKELEQRLSTPSIVDHFHDFLELQGVVIPKEIQERDVTSASVPNEQVQEGILFLYKQKPDVAILFELLTDFDEGLQEWRYRHVKLVERTIGEKHGTGGSLGVGFLKKSLFLPIFPDLWAIRHRL